VLNYRLITDEGPTAASTVTYLLPIVAVVLGIVVRHEPATWHLLVGTVIVLAGIALAQSRDHRPVAGHQ
jgi:drug/metabolite transporter (DMT)-like permease